MQAAKIMTEREAATERQQRYSAVQAEVQRQSTPARVGLHLDGSFDLRATVTEVLLDRQSLGFKRLRDRGVWSSSSGS